MDLKSMFFSTAGRIGRKTYWFNSLALSGFTFALIMMLALLLPGGSKSPSALVFVPLSIVMLLSCWCSIVLQVKRWHDRDKSGWWSLIGLVPYIGGLWAFVEVGCLPGTDGPNRFGEDPLKPAEPTKFVENLEPARPPIVPQ